MAIKVSELKRQLIAQGKDARSLAELQADANTGDKTASAILTAFFRDMNRTMDKFWQAVQRYNGQN